MRVLLHAEMWRLARGIAVGIAVPQTRVVMMVGFVGGVRWYDSIASPIGIGNSSSLPEMESLREGGEYNRSEMSTPESTRCTP